MYYIQPDTAIFKFYSKYLVYYENVNKPKVAATIQNNNNNKSSSKTTLEK